jgi:hypothetical protein
LIWSKASNHLEIARSEFTYRRNAVRLAEQVGDLAWASHPKRRPNRKMCATQKFEPVGAFERRLVHAEGRLTPFRCGTSFKLAGSAICQNGSQFQLIAPADFHMRLTPSRSAEPRGGIFGD